MDAHAIPGHLFALAILRAGRVLADFQLSPAPHTGGSSAFASPPHNGHLEADPTQPLLSEASLDPPPSTTGYGTNQKFPAGTTTSLVRTIRPLLAQIEREGIGRASIPPKRVIHFMSSSGGLIVALFATEEYPSRLAVVILKDLVDTVSKTAVTAPCPLAADLEMLVRSREAAAAGDVFTTARAQLDDTKDAMRANLERVLDREERLTDLAARSDALQIHAVRFFSASRDVDRAERLKAIRVKLAVGFAVLIIIAMVVWFGCGFPLLDRCRPRY
ncbi:synaptobrevin-domain-containing protein [Blastocladiella britannica]|nr:synaptobrevin-domain-containing protein [Blastocladiella britannica]